MTKVGVPRRHRQAAVDARGPCFDPLVDRGGGRELEAVEGAPVKHAEVATDERTETCDRRLLLPPLLPSCPDRCSPAGCPGRAVAFVAYAARDSERREDHV